MNRAKLGRRLLLVVLFASGPALYLGWCVKTGSELDRQLSLASKYGLIKTSDEINGAPVPPAENALADYIAADRARASLPTTDKELVESVADKPEEERTQALRMAGLPITMGQKDIDRARLAYKPALDHVRQAVKKPRLDYHRNWENPWDGPYLNITRLAHVLGVDALRLSRNGDIDGALENLGVIRKMAAHHFRPPFLSSMQIGMRLESEATNRATTLAWQVRKDPTAFAKVLTFLKSEPANFEFADGMPVEILSSMWAVDQMGRDPLKLGLHPEDLVFELKAYKLAGFRQREQAEMVRICRETYERYHGMGRDFVAMFQKLRKLEPDTATTSAFNDVIESRFLPMPDYTYTIQSGASRQVRRHLAIAGAELTAIHGRTGRFPDKLPATPTMIDPMTGEPFSYIVKGEKCALYSGGLDGQNGKPNEYSKTPVYSQQWTLYLPPNDPKNLGAPVKSNTRGRE